MFDLWSDNVFVQIGSSLGIKISPNSTTILEPHDIGSAKDAMVNIRMSNHQLIRCRLIDQIITFLSSAIALEEYVAIIVSLDHH